MRLTSLALILLATSSAVGQQIPCTKFDEQQGYKTPEYVMKGCRSFNELQAAGGIKVAKGKSKLRQFVCSEGRPL
jgi:hypothetical protein